MWSRKELKKEARLTLKNNYLQTIIVCLVMAIFVSSYTSPTTAIRTADDTVFHFKGMSNSEIVNSILSGNNPDNTLFSKDSEGDMAAKGVLANIFNNVTKSSSFVFGVLNSLNQFFFRDRIMASILCVSL